MSEVLTEEILFTKSPQELTTILYEGCIAKLEEAIEAIKAHDYSESNRLLQQCNDILVRLGGGLNYEAGIIADQLEAIYRYSSEKLIEANMKKDIQLVEEVLHILMETFAGWQIALEKGEQHVPPSQKKRMTAYDTDFMDGNIDIKE